MSALSNHTGQRPHSLRRQMIPRLFPALFSQGGREGGSSVNSDCATPAMLIFFFMGRLEGRARKDNLDLTSTCACMPHQQAVESPAASIKNTILTILTMPSGNTTLHELDHEIACFSGHWRTAMWVLCQPNPAWDWQHCLKASGKHS